MLTLKLNLAMDWTSNFLKVRDKIQSTAEAASHSGGLPTQKLAMLETVVRPVLRYHMSAAPFSWNQIDNLNGILMRAARKACGLSRHASTGLMMEPRDNFGVGVDSVHLTYAMDLYNMTQP